VKSTRHAVILSLLFVGTLFTSPGWRSTTNVLAQQAPAPDNTKTNQRDRSDNAATADQQKENRSDRELARRIRRAIVKDKSLSTYAHNVKVVVQNGAVTLKGPVRTEEDKKAIEGKATEAAGEGKVTSELEVQPEK
jgi:hyperosmotically inducible protein